MISQHIDEEEYEERHAFAEGQDDVVEKEIRELKHEYPKPDLSHPTSRYNKLLAWLQTILVKPGEFRIAVHLDIFGKQSVARTSEDVSLASLCHVLLECYDVDELIEFVYRTRASSVIGKETLLKKNRERKAQQEALEQASADSLLAQLRALGHDVHIGVPAVAVPIATPISAVPVSQNPQSTEPAAANVGGAAANVVGGAASTPIGPVQAVQELFGFTGKRQRQTN
ncbi:hypothetical protein CYMTET_13503 [Cymbomonas tetramitiformis]|uniref:Uncharacterized protein n=1 Tax=Cymbomonas tetramitiformis TaxID=36881 RepID=A0AAE0LB44_9CHLO|nr:hypothetical protein CYMTET_13503 [Cymbomonas tetramitiformis]